MHHFMINSFTSHTGRKQRFLHAQSLALKKIKTVLFLKPESELKTYNI